ncbi:MAG: Smr/MutS family protein [Chitinophagales bacterium]|nr:Smr/MutS family protein [Chitinophagales bacterium]
MTNALIKSLDLDLIFAWINDLLSSSGAKLKWSQFKLLDKEAIKHSYAIQQELNYLRDMALPYQFDLSVDLTEISRYIHLENYVAPQEKIYHIFRMLDAWVHLEGILDDKTPVLSKLLSPIDTPNDIHRQLDKAFDERGEIKVDFDIRLAQLRKKIELTHQKILESFEKEVTDASNKGFLAETKESYRQNRLVLSVKKEFKRQIKGVLVDISDQAGIFYIQPQGCAQMQQEIEEWELEYREILYQILLDFTQDIFQVFSVVNQINEIFLDLEIEEAKRKFIQLLGGNYPIISDEFHIKLGKNPILTYLALQESKKIIPFNLSLTPEKRGVLISGPNAGGKSVILKTLGQFAFMARYGIGLTCEAHSEIAFIHNFYVDIYDHQSIEDELSTFSAKIKIWNEVIQKAGKNDLVLIDELGSGSDPKFTASLGQVILEEIAKSQAYFIGTSHFSDIKRKCQGIPSFEMGAMLIDTQTYQPLYQLLLGKPGASYTFEIAKNNGFPTALLEQAKAYIDQNALDYEEILEKFNEKELELKSIKDDMLSQDLALKKEIKRWDKLNNELDYLRKKLSFERLEHKLESQNAQLNLMRNFEAELKKKKSMNQIHEKASRLEEEKKHTEDEKLKIYQSIHQYDPKDLKVGDTVRIIDTSVIGTIVSLKDKKALIAQDQIKMNIDIAKLEPTQTNTAKKTTKVNLLNKTNLTLEETIDLRGKNFSESLEILDDIINKCLIHDKSLLRVIHGSGALRHKLIPYFDKHRNIIKHHAADEKLGGIGISYLYL